MRSVRAGGRSPLNMLIIGSGTSLHVRNWVAFLAERGHHVTLLTDESPDVPGVTTLRLPAAGLPRRMRWVLGGLTARRTRGDGRWDVVHLHSVGAPAFASWTSPGARLAVSPWGSEVFHALNRPARWLIVQNTVRRAAEVLTTSREMSRIMVARAGVDPRRVHVISWGVDLSTDVLGERKQPSVSRSFGLPDDKTIVTAIRPVSPLHQTEQIVRSLAEANQRRSDLHLVLLHGYEPVERNALKSKRDYERQVISGAHRFLGDNFTFVERTLSAHEMSALLRVTDIALSTPVSDQRSTAVLEALAAGAWLICSDIAPYRELAADGYLMSLVSPPLAASLAKTITGSMPSDEALLSNRHHIARAESRSEHWQAMEEALRSVANAAQ